MAPSQASVDANQPEQTEITYMSCDSYNAATEGKLEFFKAIPDHGSLGRLLTPNKNTILHIYITALNSGSNSTILNAGSKSIITLNAESESTTLNARSESTANFVEEILKMCPSLSRQANAKDETPFHIAARYGHDDIVKFLIKYCDKTLRDQDLEKGIGLVKEMLRMTNKEKDTALHEAVRYNHLEVVKLLIREDPNFSYSANDAGETPLYIDAEREFKDVLLEILNKCESPMHGGPLSRTALHATVINHDREITEYNMGMIARILEKIEGISREVDNNSWTPLHFAAYFRRGDVVEKLLDKDREVAYMKDTKGRTPLHIAAQHGGPSALKVIVERCPDCCEVVDNRGWNVLHFAIKGSRPWCLGLIMEIIIEKGSLSNLLNEKNAEGDAPLHFYSRYCTCLELPSFISDPRVDKKAFNKQNFNAREIASTVLEHSSYKEVLKFRDAIGHLLPQRVITHEDDTTKLEDRNKESTEKEKEKEKKEKEKKKITMLQKTTEVHLVVAALIATVTFAACITMPGGFVGGGEDSHPGSVLLRRKVAFKVFVITDTISMVLSSSAVFIHLLMPIFSNNNIDDDDDEKDPMKLLYLAFRFILWAMIAMVLAFVMGTYAVLMPSLDLAITNCIIGLTFFAILLCVFQKFLDFSLFDVFKILCIWKFD